jgi:tetraacyldisaccharide 4'-kinase
MRADERLARRGGAIELLRVPALAFSALARARRSLYDRRLLPIARVSVPVVSIGNLTTGGTGKTPMCALVVRALIARGFRPGILSRGYGAAPGAANDEARLLAYLLPTTPHVQGADRVGGARELIRGGANAIVLDDGFQHRRLARDVDIVLVDATRPFGLASADGVEPVRALLPRGLLREPPSSLRRSDLIVLTRTEAVTMAATEAVERELERIAPGRPIARAALRMEGWIDEKGRAGPVDHLRGREVDVVSALGNPSAFEASVVKAGALVRDRRVFADHHRYTRADLAGLPAPGRVLVTSAKDAVKLAPLGVEFFALQVELELVTGAHVLDALLDALPNPSRSAHAVTLKSDHALT